MFSPKKSDSSKPKPGGPPQGGMGPPSPGMGGPPMGPGPSAPGDDLMSAMMGGMGGMGGQPGMPPPGGGMDPMSAMMGGLSLPQQAEGSVMGPDGFPVGGSAPEGADDGGSDLLSALGMSHGDPYAQPPGTNGMGEMSGPPDGGQAELMQMLALLGLGVNPADAQDLTMKPPGMAGSSGVDHQMFNPGMMAGL